MAKFQFPVGQAQQMLGHDTRSEASSPQNVLLLLPSHLTSKTRMGNIQKQAWVMGKIRKDKTTLSHFF